MPSHEEAGPEYRHLPPQETFRAGVHTEDPYSLMPFFADAYGPRFREKDVSRYLSGARLITLYDTDDQLVAAAVINQTRIIMSAPTMDERYRGQRLGLKINVLEACREDGHAGWATVGSQYPKIQYAYQAAGMEIVNDNIRADRILSEVLAPDRKLDRDEQDNLIIVTGFLSDRQGYQQHLFAWPEFTPLEPTP